MGCGIEVYIPFHQIDDGGMKQRIKTIEEKQLA
jgi:hypothetical protein